MSSYRTGTGGPNESTVAGGYWDGRALGDDFDERLARMDEHVEHEPRSDWHETYDNVTRLGRYLFDQGYSVAELQAYYEKPWKWSYTWRRLYETGKL